jgi:NADPH-dependent curcumin reductase CurA
MQNRQFKLVARPQGLPKRTDFEFATPEVGQPGPGEVLVEVQFLSLDPAMRGWMREGKSYLPPVGLGEVMRAGGLGKVVQSNDPALQVNDIVSGMTGIQAYAMASAKSFSKIDERLAPLPRFLGALGMTGLTAYFGLLSVGQPKAGETVVVSGAAGAVGAQVGQIAKLKGCRVVGIAGGPDKCRYLLDELGFDAAIDYKHEDVGQKLREHCPKGIDVYFDNVGGDILDAALANLAFHARVVICGAISQYNATSPPAGPKNYLSLLVQRARMEGFLVMDYYAQAPQAIAEMATWLADGRLKAREDIVQGIETFPETLLKLFSGENDGKLILAV